MNFSVDKYKILQMKKKVTILYPHSIWFILLRKGLSWIVPQNTNTSFGSQQDDNQNTKNS